MLLESDRNRVINRASDLAEELNGYLDTFVANAPLYKFRDFFERGQNGNYPSDAIAHLFNYAVEFVTLKSSSATVTWLPIIRNENPKPCSWLMRFRPQKGGNLTTTIVLDPRNVRSTVASNEQRLINFLCLHEIGHIFFHWDTLFIPGISGRASFPTAKQEAEAWVFCFAFATLCAEEVAQNFRDTPYTSMLNAEHVWELLSRMTI